MKSRSEQRHLRALGDYAAGLRGTRQAVQRAGVEDDAEVVVALARHDRNLPKPADTSERRANLERARAILQPRLRDAGW